MLNLHKNKEGAAGKEKRPQNRISEKFEYLRKKGEKALITFITAGDPDLSTTEEIVLALERAGADMVELGVPYSDPLADGPVIQQASQRSLKAGTNLSKIFNTAAALRKKTQIPIILMTYYNPLLRYGLANVVADARNSGIDGFIVPDLPMEEADVFRKMLLDKQVYLIPLVAPTSGKERIQKIASLFPGFIYCVSVTGVTGVRAGLPENLQQFMHDVRSVTSNPLAVGFGISSPEQVEAVSGFCDAVIVGSVLVKTIGEKSQSDELISTVSETVRKLKKPLKAISGGSPNGV